MHTSPARFIIVRRMKSTIVVRLYSRRFLPGHHHQLNSRRRYALSELQKDVEAELLLHPESERESLRSATKFAIFVVHNKKKPKLAELSHDVLYECTLSFSLETL